MNWSYAYDLQLWPASFVVALAIFLGWYSWRRRSILAARLFAIGCLFGALWALGTVLQISALDFPVQVFWVKFQTVWMVPVGTALTGFILAYAGLGRWLTRRTLILLSIPPLLFMGLAFTNGYHHLVWTGFQLDENGYVISLAGIANRVFFGYVYLLGLVNFTVMLWLAGRSPRHRWPVGIMLSGQVVGRGTLLLSYLEGGLLGPGETVFLVLGVIASAYAIALFRFHVFDPIPMARAAVIDQIGDGMLVIDLEGRIVDWNPAAPGMLGKPANSLRGRAVKELLPNGTDLPLQKYKAGPSSFEIRLGSGIVARYYRLNISSLVDGQEQVLGHLLLLHEITEEKQAQEQILEQQQVMATLQERERLARELHDSTGQVLGYVNLQAETIRKWLQSGNKEKADSLLARLAEVAKDAHADVRESILGLKTGAEGEWSFLPVLERYLDNFESQYGIHAEMTLSDGLRGISFGPVAEVQLLRVIQEALTNARKHSGAQTIRVAFKLEDSRANITITDDGAGFNPGQLNQGPGHHFGLGFMRERMEQIGGSISFVSGPGTGTTVKLELPFLNQQEGAI